MRIRSLLVIVTTLVAVLVSAALPSRGQGTPPPPRAADTTSQLPPGDGRDIVQVTCSQCHSLTAIMQLREGRTAWRHQVYDMIGRGAQVSPAEIDVMVNYLTANFGPGIPFPGQTPSHVQLAVGAGSELVTAKCSLCHGVDRVVAAKRSRGQWDTIVKKMLYLGAPLTPDQAKSVVDYLSTNYSAGKS